MTCFASSTSPQDSTLVVPAFFQVFVVVEVELDLFDQLLRQIGQSFVGVAVVAVIGWNADDFVVYFAVVNEFHHADNACFQENTGCQRLLGNQQYVQFVAVFVQSLRNEAVVGRFGENCRFNAVELEAASLRFHSILWLLPAGISLTTLMMPPSTSPGVRILLKSAMMVSFDFKESQTAKV